MMPSVAILAGGLATRLRPLTEKIPKSMVEIAGKPFVHHQLTLLKSQGIERVVLCTGYLGEQIAAYVGDGHNYGLAVTYSYDGEKLLGTGAAVRACAAAGLLSDPFWVLYGDSYLELDLAPILSVFSPSPKLGLMTVFKNENKFDQSNIHFAEGSVVKMDKSNPKLQYIDYGLSLLRHAALDLAPPEAFDLSSLFKILITQNQLLGFEAKKRFYEIGSAQGLADTQHYFEHNHSI